MMLIFEIRAKLTELYQRHDLIVKTALKFLLMFLSFRKLSKVIGYNTGLSGFGVILGLSVFSAVLPPSLMVFVAAAYIFLQLITASVLIAVTVVLIFLIMYLFFLRFAPKEGITIIATPLLCSMGFPYVVPLFLGMFGSFFSLVPAVCGVAAFYLLKAVKDNIITIDELKAAKDQALVIYMNVLDDLLKNPRMYVVMAVFAVVIVTVVFVRTIKMDYAFEIALGVGTGVMILSYILGSLKYDMDLAIGGMVFGSLICMGIVFVCLFFYRVLNYSAAEHVQFEDERYYYYVTAVPKITANSPRRAIRKVMSRREDVPEDEDEESAIEAMNSMLANKNNPYGIELTAGEAKRLRKDLASKNEPDYDDEDEDEEVVITGPKNRGNKSDGEDEAVISGSKSRGGKKKNIKAPLDSIVAKLRGIGALLPAKKNRPAKPVPAPDYDDEDDEDEDAQLYFAEDSDEDGGEDENLR